MLKGHTVSPGVALAPACVYLPDTLKPHSERIAPEQIETEIEFVNAGIRAADGELARLIESFPESEKEQAKIFAAQRESASVPLPTIL